MTEKRNNDFNVPTLRFPGFEGGDISSYRKYYFKDIFLFSTGKNIKQNEASPEFEIPCVRYGELYHMYNEVITEVVNKTNIDKSELRFSDGDEILLPSAGEDPLDIGSASALTIQGVAIGRTINVLKPAADNIYSQVYVSYYINHRLRKTISSLAKGVSISNVYNSDLKTLEIILPNLTEQNKIADFLSLIDRRIQTQNKIIEELKLLKSTLCNQLIVENNGLAYRVSDIATIGRGRVINSREINQSKPIYPVYSSQTSNDGIMGYLDKYDFDGEYITWTTDGANAGTVFYRNGKFNCTNVCGVLKIKNPSMYNAVFVSLALQRQTKKFVSTNLANPKLMNNVMAGITLDLPEIEIQNKIARIILGIETKISNEIQYLAKLSKQKTYLLNKLFK